MLTTALNKSPKPPIIVDDILVNELNLGSVPPELEILEVGDLAEDRFRGIFKMCYSGDAFLTLQTRVQVRYEAPFPSLGHPISDMGTLLATVLALESFSIQGYASVDTLPSARGYITDC